MSAIEQVFWLLPLGFIVGVYGTLIGAGGGFVLMPVLLLMYRGESPEILTSISLAVVFFNAFSGSLAYARMKRIDYRAGFLFSAAAIPGAVLGALTTAYIPRRLFDAVLGAVMIGAAIFLIFRPRLDQVENKKGEEEAHKERQRPIYNVRLGTGLSLFVGYFSSLLGIGGGIIHVPAMVYFLNFPVHTATATSHFILAIMTLAGTAVHICTGTFHHGVHRTMYLGLGVLLGAQLGAFLSGRIRGVWIMRGLATALGVAGIRIVLLAMHSA